MANVTEHAILGSRGQNSRSRGQHIAVYLFVGPDLYIQERKVAEILDYMNTFPTARHVPRRLLGLEVKDQGHQTS